MFSPAAVTVMVNEDVVVPELFVAVSVNVVVVVGDMVIVPLVTVPTPLSIDIVVAPATLISTITGAPGLAVVVDGANVVTVGAPELDPAEPGSVAGAGSSPVTSPNVGLPQTVPPSVTVTVAELVTLPVPSVAVRV